MQSLMIRTAQFEDLPDIVCLENTEWCEEQRCTLDNFSLRLNHFQNGFLVAYINNKIVASFYAIRRHHHIGKLMNWKEESGHGTGNTHDPRGDSLFSVSITVSHQAPKGVYRKMMEAWRALAIKQNVKCMYAGSRIPGLRQQHETPNRYLAKVKSGEIFDPILSKAIYCGFSIGNLIPNYFGDPESLHYGVEIFQII